MSKNKNYVNKLLKAFNEKKKLTPDNWTTEKIYSSGMKKWIGGIVPFELLIRSVKDAVNSLMTLNQEGIFYEKFPDDILTPDYGDKWGVRANYIEINNLVALITLL